MSFPSFLSISEDFFFLLVQKKPSFSFFLSFPSGMKRTREFWFFFFFCLTGSTSSFTFQFRLCPKAENRKVKLIDNVNAIVSIFNLLSLICLTFVTNAYFQSLQINFTRRFKRLKLRPTFPLRFFGGPSLHYVSLEANAKEGRNERTKE